jgi:putative Flp pilus-assembly TadE/G-like protein
MRRFDRPCARRPRDCAPERAQTLPFTCLFLVMLLVMAGLVIDLGDGYLQRRNVQNVADAAALAAAQGVPTNTYQTDAQASLHTNGKPSDLTQVIFDGRDTVTVKVTRQAPTFLLGLLNQKSITVSSTATAKVEALAQVQGHVAPFAVTPKGYDDGQGTQIFGQSQPSAYGIIDLPTPDNTTGGSCDGATYGGTPPNVKDEVAGTQPAGVLQIGGCVEFEPGAEQPAANAVDNLQPTGLSDPMSQDLRDIGNGIYQVIPQSYDQNGLPPRLMYVPIITTDPIPGANGHATIQGFAWFYVTGTSGGGSKLTITGRFVTVEIAGSGQTTTWVPGLPGQVITVELTG